MHRDVRADHLNEPQLSAVPISQVHPMLTRFLSIVDGIDDHTPTQAKQF